MKIKLFKKEKHFEKKEFVFNTDFYWKIAVGVAITVIILSAAFGYYLFTETNTDVVLPATTEGVQIPIVKTNSLEKVLNYFSEREKKSSQILNSPSSVVDPSI